MGPQSNKETEMALYRLDITTSDNGMAEKLGGTTKWELARRISSYFRGLGAGSNLASLDVATGATAAKATGTAALTTVVAGNTLTIGSTTFTGTDGTPGAAGFQTGVTDDASRDSIIAKVNANTTAKTYVTASKGGVAASGTLTCLGAVAGNAPHSGATTFTAVAPTAAASTVQFNIPNYLGIAVFAASSIDSTHTTATVTLASWTNAWTENNWTDAVGRSFDAYVDGTTVWSINNSNAALVLQSVDPVNRVLTFSGNSTDITNAASDTCYLYTRDYYNTKTAQNLAAAINANAVQNLLVVATSALGVVTITALDKGTLGNAFTLTAGTNIARGAATLASGTCVVALTANQIGGLGNTIALSRVGGPIAVSGAYLSGGVDLTATTYSYGV